MEKYQILNEIGRGTFGIVLKAQNKETKEIVAIKQMIQEYETWEECINLRELKALRKLVHPNIVKLKEVLKVKKTLLFVFEYVEKNIYVLYENAKTEGQTSLPDQTIRLIVYQVASALSYMHKHGFFHRDLKPENLLISSENVVKLIDLGLVREIRSRPPFTDYVSTRWYRAPEILLRSTNYNSPVDIFALGCIMVELYLMKPLFNGSSEIDQLQKITSFLGTPSRQDWPDGYILASQKYFTFPTFPPVPLAQAIPNCPPDGLNLIQEMLKWDPQKRITTQKILAHPYFLNIELPEEINQGEKPISNQIQHSEQNISSNQPQNQQKGQGQKLGVAYSIPSNFNHQSQHQRPHSPSSTYETSQFKSQQQPYHQHSIYQSNSPDARYTQQNEIANVKVQDGPIKQVLPIHHQSSTSFTIKKNYDPIYEFLTNDAKSINIPPAQIAQTNIQNDKATRFNIGNNYKIEEDIEDIEQDILGTYLATGALTRVRNNYNNNTTTGGLNTSVFGQQGQDNLNPQGLYINNAPRPNRGAINQQPPLDIYKFDATKQAQNPNGFNQTNQVPQNKVMNNIYNFDNVISTNTRKMPMNM